MLLGCALRGSALSSGDGSARSHLGVSFLPTRETPTIDLLVSLIILGRFPGGLSRLESRTQAEATLTDFTPTVAGAVSQVFPTTRESEPPQIWVSALCDSIIICEIKQDASHLA